MMNPTALINSIMSGSTASGSKSTVMQPMIWLILALISGNIASHYWNFSFWIQVGLGILLIVSVLIFLGVYIYFAIKNPDAIRSESFTLQKMAIEKNLIGDSTVGLTEIPEFSEVKEVTLLPPTKEGEK